MRGSRAQTESSTPLIFVHSHSHGTVERNKYPDAGSPLAEASVEVASCGEVIALLSVKRAHEECLLAFAFLRDAIRISEEPVEQIGIPDVLTFHLILKLEAELVVPRIKQFEFRWVPSEFAAAFFMAR